MANTHPEPLSPLPTAPAQVTLHKSSSTGELSIIHRSSAAVEARPPTFWLWGCPDFRAVYENPLITATSRAFISDIHALTRRCCAVDVPRPLSILHTLLGARPPNSSGDDPWFKAIRSWAEVDDVSETVYFDGHKKSFVEYTLNILFLPDLHTTYRMPRRLVLRHPLSSPAESQLSLSDPASPCLPIPGTFLSLPSPLHFQLPVMTRLCFNEQGQITHHRDIWDVRDVVRLIPGVRVALWIMTRAGAWGLCWISQVICSTTDSDSDVSHGKSISRESGLLTSVARSSI